MIDDNKIEGKESQWHKTLCQNNRTSDTNRIFCIISVINVIVVILRTFMTIIKTMMKTVTTKRYHSNDQMTTTIIMIINS